VEKALLQIILEAVIQEHALPDDTCLAGRVKQSLHEAQEPEAGQVTASMVETIRLRWGIHRPILTQQLQAAQPPANPGPEQVRLGQTRVGGLYPGRAAGRDGVTETGSSTTYGRQLRRHIHPIAADCSLCRHFWGAARLSPG